MPEQPTPSEAVYRLQTYLRQISYDTPGMTQPPINGYFGVATQRALEEFQTSKALPVTGVADQITWEALYAAYLTSKKANAPTQKMDIFPRTPQNAVLDDGSRGFAVAAVQFMLQRLEAHYGTIGAVAVTGEYSAETKAAVTVFQQSSALRPDGVVTGEVWNELVSQYNMLFTDPTSA